MQWRIPVVLWGVAVIWGLGCGEGAADVTEDDQVEESVSAIVGGELTFERPEIGRVYYSGGGPCTGTLIHPRVVITAKHCLGYTSCDENCAYPRAGFEFRGKDGRMHIYRFKHFRSFKRDVGFVENREYSNFGYYSFKPDSYILTDDVSIALLDEPVPAELATPAKLAMGQPEPGRSLTVWGYGCTDRDTKEGSGRKRKASFEADGPSNFLCSGDSGGPVTDTENGHLYMVNCATATLRTGRVSSVYGDVVRLRGYIDTQLANWGITLDAEPEPEPVEPDPEPIEPEPSEPECRPYETTPPESGMPLRISLLWPEKTDLDLFILDPAGQTIYYANRTTPEGAELKKADCLSLNCPEIDSGSDYAEWVEWSGKPPQGEYKIWAVNYNGQATAHYTIQVESDRGNTSFEGRLATRGESTPSWSFTYEDREVCD